jgi:hypothetical protein
MSWYEKEKPTPFDELPLPGLWFLDGDILAQLYERDWTAGQKMPLVVFPSGEEFQLWETGNPAVWGIIHLFGELDLAYKDSRDRAFEEANHIAEQVGYAVYKVGEDGLEVWGHDEDEHYLITYDDQTGQMRDVAPVKSDAEPPKPPGLLLMSEEIREKLPKLGETEEQGMDALAQVKYFTPDADWTFYASEYDGEDTFYGLVVGLEIELGSFSLSELQQVRGPFGLAIERDLYYEPQTLAELIKYHRRMRGE